LIRRAYTLAGDKGVIKKSRQVIRSYLGRNR
jgi:hypothetical protein